MDRFLALAIQHGLVAENDTVAINSIAAKSFDDDLPAYAAAVKRKKLTKLLRRAIKLNKQRRDRIAEGETDTDDSNPADEQPVKKKRLSEFRKVRNKVNIAPQKALLNNQ